MLASFAVDSDVFTVEYPSALHLMEHLKVCSTPTKPLQAWLSPHATMKQGMGEQSALKHTRAVSQDLMLAVASAYQAMHGNPNGSITATFEAM